MEGDWEVASRVDGARTLVLLGRTGNGKSATGNTIIGKKVFKSKRGSSGVTHTCELQKSVLPGQIVEVIDTPGIFDTSVGPEFISKEIIKCIDQAKGGIHAVLFVLSVSSRFTEEEEAAFQSVINLFGEKVVNHTIIVFTGGDVLEDDGVTLGDYLCNCSPALKVILSRCEDRMVLFDNKTKDEEKISEQVEQLLIIVNTLVEQNDGQAYTKDLLVANKKGAKELELSPHQVMVEDEFFFEELYAYEAHVEKVTELVLVRSDPEAQLKHIQPHLTCVKTASSGFPSNLDKISHVLGT